MSANVGTDTTVGTFAVAGHAPVDFDDFHRHELPRRLEAGVNAQVTWDVAGRAPCAVQLPGGSAYSYIARGDRVEIVPGVVDDAELVLEIPYTAWQDYVYEFRTRFGLLYSQAVDFVRGDFDTWDHWEPAIRCMYSGREIYNPKALDFRDLDGSPLDLHRSFAHDDSPELMAHFLRTTGYLVVKDAFADRLEEISDEVNRLRDEAQEGELWSWWASDETERRFPFRLLYMAQRSELIASLDDDPTVRALDRPRRCRRRARARPGRRPSRGAQAVRQGHRGHRLRQLAVAQGLRPRRVPAHVPRGAGRHPARRRQRRQLAARDDGGLARQGLPRPPVRRRARRPPDRRARDRAR